MPIPLNKVLFLYSSCEEQVLFKDIHEHVSYDHKVWALNLATKIDGKTFKVMYSGFIVGRDVTTGATAVAPEFSENLKTY